SQIVEVDKIHFEEGIPGFNELRFFRLIQEESGSPLFSLLSLENEHVGFWLIDPFSFFHDYEFLLKDSHKQALNIKEG
ncbi:flagellar assembly protein FliW, partial [Rhizobium ruizarguesonis]